MGSLEIATSEIFPSEPEVSSGVVEGKSFEEFILKIQSRCNLACDYCYMYEMADQSWRDQPKFMARRTLAQTAMRVAEHARTHDLSETRIILHGGEPLLAEKRDPDYLPWTTAMFRNVVGKVVGEDNVHFLMQTNGTLVTRPILDKMSTLGVKMGVSIDGRVEAHDAHRTYASGRGSYYEVRKAIELMNRGEYRHTVFGGLLCTINLDNDPLDTYELLTYLRAPSIDFLLPLAHWSELPSGYADANSSEPYADWLIPIYDRWHSRGSQPRIRIFDAITNLLLEKPSNAEYIGLDPPANVVVETNGEIQQVDSLKSVAQGAPDMGMNVWKHSFDDALKHPKTRERQMGFAALSSECQKCELVEVCGGGYYPHRYKEGTGFQNRSVYCDALMKLIRHVAEQIKTDLIEATLDGLAGPDYRRSSF